MAINVRETPTQILTEKFMSWYYIPKLKLAFKAMDLTYDHWLKYKDNHHPLSRGMALKAKTYALIAHDRILCPYGNLYIEQVRAMVQVEVSNLGRSNNG